MPGLFAGTSLERLVTCERCNLPLGDCTCPRLADGRIVLQKDQRARVVHERRGATGKILKRKLVDLL
ncbi:MAG: hypothetical protein IPK83_15890 [Planctomycetes bacterium]|nr:hypothetical protein [Planctomycetota bacterium]